MKKTISLILCLILFMSILSSCIPRRNAYRDFTQSEKDLFLKYVGEVIPFAPTKEYKVTELYAGRGYEKGIRYYTVGNTKEEYESYRALYSSYSLDFTEHDGRGTYTYHYSKGNVGVSMSYYTYNSNNFIDVSAYYLYREPLSEAHLSNNGAGLPEGENGVYTIDFTKSAYAHTAGDLTDNRDGCPSTGEPGVLVIPISFSERPAAQRGYSINKINSIFNGRYGETDYFSVYDYYKRSSYGRLDLNITVLDEWFVPSKSLSYYKSKTKDYGGTEVFIGDQIILDEALDYLDDRMDLSEFDSDGNGTIDAVVMVSSLNIDYEENLEWAYKYRNMYEDKNGQLKSYDGVYALDYVWVPYAFMFEQISSGGRPSYSNQSVMNPQTFIHEFAHLLGAEDYYDTTHLDEDGPLKGHDIMDYTLGDHNPYTKFTLGWIDKARLVTADKPITLTLKPFSDSGDAVIIGNNWDEQLGAFQEYFIVIYYRTIGLNSGKGGYFDEDGILIYHVNAELYYEEYLFDGYYELVNDNATQSLGGSANNLIELVPVRQSMLGNSTYLFTEGKSLGTTFDDSGKRLGYTLTVISLAAGEAVISFNKK